MTIDALKPLLENDLLGDDAKQAIVEAWENNLKEAREEIEVQLREEFTSRYEHDKGILVEAVERMVEDGITAEISEFVADRKKLTTQQVKLAEEIRQARIEAKTKLAEQMKLLEAFVLNQLKEEIGEFEQDRRDVKEGKKQLVKQLRESRVAYNKQLDENTKKLEKFVLQQLSDEMKDFHQDKVALREQRVKLITEGKKKIDETRKQFIKRSSKLVETKLNEILHNEMSQFKDDIIAARKKKFGMDMFEAFAAEYKTTFFNENSEVRELKKQIAESKHKFGEATKLFEAAKNIAVESDKKQKLAENRANRVVLMNELLSKLSGSQKEVMAELLEGVKTNNLREAFRKYIPAVTSGSGTTALSRKTSEKKALQENRKEITGNRINKLNESVESDKERSDTAEIIKMKRLAGI